MIVRLCAAAAYMVVAGHEERSRDDHCQRMLEMAKVRGNCPLPWTIKILPQQYAGDSQGAGCNQHLGYLQHLGCRNPARDKTWPGPG